MPATFTITAGGSLDPPTISVPAGFPVELTVVSGDGKAHRVVVRTPVAQTLKVPAHGRASVRLTKLRPGGYTLEVDGAARGTLEIGGQPGP